MTGDPMGRLPGPDLLDNLTDAQTWLDQASRSWSELTGREAPLVALTESDLRHLRTFREALFVDVSHRSHGLPVAGPGLDGYRADAHLMLDADGTATLAPKGRGWKLLLSWLLLELHRSQRNNSWSRVKACKNVKCRGVFYDSSKNNSGAWHDVRTCGNVANLRASRARKKQHSA